MNRKELRLQLLLHEGMKLKPYKDTVNKLTIGVGRNLTDRGITDRERLYLGFPNDLPYEKFELSRGQAFYLLDNDIDEVLYQLNKQFSWFKDLSKVRQHVLLDMCFNMGITTLLGFYNTLRFIRDKKYQAAAGNMLISKWANQVGQRSKTLSYMMYNDDYTEDLKRYLNDNRFASTSDT